MEPQDDDTSRRPVTEGDRTVTIALRNVYLALPAGSPPRPTTTPAAIPGHLCEQCLDAPASVFAPAPWGGEMGVCDACHQASVSAALPLLTARQGQQTLWHTIDDPARLVAYRAASATPLPAWWDRCVTMAPARVCVCG